MKKQIIFPVLLLFLVAGFKKASDTLTDLATTLADVKERTVEQIGNQSFSLPSFTKETKDACRKLPAGVREATMMSLGKIVRDYVSSPAFKTDYNAWADAHFSVRKFDSTDAKWTQERKQKTTEMEAAMNNPQMAGIYIQQLDAQSQMAENMIDILKKNPTMNLGGLTIKDFQQQADDAKMLKGLSTGNKAAFTKKYAEVMVGQQLRSEMMQEKQQQADQEKKLAEAKDYAPIIKKELQQFLDASAGIDFNAKLVARGNTMVFADPQYEQKDGNWKFYYRCGKEAVTGARQFAQSWLADLH